MIARTVLEDSFRVAVAQRDPGLAVRDALARLGITSTIAIAIGKAAIRMAHGVGPVVSGLAVVNAADVAPPGWDVIVAAHPDPDLRSVAAGAAVMERIEQVAADEIVLVLISGGASALIEQPLTTLDELRSTIRALTASGAPIEEINTVRAALSSIKAGKLALRCRGRIITLVASDVIGDPLAVIGSGPTVGPWLATPRRGVDIGAVHDQLRLRAREILTAQRITLPAILDAPIASRQISRDDHAEVVIPMASLADAMIGVLASRGLAAGLVAAPLSGDVRQAADLVAAVTRDAGAPRVLWGEPTVQLAPDHGEGGRAQQLALELARRFRGGSLSALVVGTDGRDGPEPRARAAPAGAYVDGATWEAIERAGIDPARSLAICDAGTALAAIGALVVTGPTGINHADLVVVG